MAVATRNMTGIDNLADEGAERALLGCLLVDQDAMAQVDGNVVAKDFYDEGRRAVFATLVELYQGRVKVDVLTVRERLQTRGLLETAGGASGVMDLMSAAPDFTHALDYARVVRRLGTLRRLVMAAAAIVKDAYAGRGDDLSAVLERARRALESVEGARSGDGVLLWLDSLSGFLEAQWERLAELDVAAKGGKKPYLELPWQAFQRFSARLRPGTLALVAAASGVGKTTFLECCAEAWARQGVRVAFFHLELSHRQMLDRRTSRLAGVPLSEVEDGAVTAEVDRAVVAMRGWPGGITYVHCPGWTAAQVAAERARLQAKGLCDVALVDYLQKLTLPRTRGQNKSDDIGDAVEQLKIDAERAGVPYMVASQFNRAAEGAERKTGAYIRGSGEPYEKANLALTLDRQILSGTETDGMGRITGMAGDLSGEVKGRVDKNTGGPTGDLRLWLDARRFLLTDLSREPEPEGGRDDLDF